MILRKPIGSKFLLILFFWIISLLLDLEYSFGYLGFFDVILLIGLVSLVLTLIGILRMLWKQKTDVLRLGLFGLLFVVSELFVVVRILQWQKQQSIKTGQEIDAALEGYKEKHSEYPVALNDLVPNYLTTIPKSNMGWFGKPFLYSKSSMDSSYTMSFAFHAFTICYKATNIDWFCGD